MKNLFVLSTITLATLVSCAGPETYQEKMSRYTPKVVGVNQVPEFRSAGFKFKEKAGRGPASAETPTSVEKALTEETTLSNKKLYFLTLFGQYESMKKYAQEFDAPSVNICPHFHNSLLEHNGRKPAGFAGNITYKNNKKFVYDMTKFSDEDYIAKRPELSLPLSKDEVTPRVIDIFRSEAKTMTDTKMNELARKALDIHLAKTYGEIRELCEFGVSDNYYVYENLITHIKNSSFPPAEKNMDTLLKTTLFSNIALVTSLEKIQATTMRSIASVEPKVRDNSLSYSNEVMTRLNVEWAREYFESLKSSK